MKPLYQIHKIGVEIECEVLQEVIDDYRENFGQVKSDGSINCCRNSKCLVSFFYARELVTRPIQLKVNGKPRKLFYQMFYRLQKAYKNKQFHWNDTMGCHLHISFKPEKKPSILWSKKFYDYLCQFWRAEFSEMYLARRDNNYCEVKQTESKMFSFERYQALNFQSAYNKHKTLEIRIFNTTEPRIMKQYILKTIEAINLYLADPANYILEPERVEIKQQKINYSTTETLRIIKFSSTNYYNEATIPPGNGYETNF